MRTAILISGHMRTFDRCLPTLHWHVFRHFPDADFYVSTVQDPDASKAELLRAKYPDARVEIDVVEQPDCIADLRSQGCQLPTEWQHGQPYMHEPYAITARPLAIARQLWQLEQCWHLLRRSVGDPSEYDLIIRCRPDLWFHSLVLPIAMDNPDPGIAYTPWWGCFGGVNDRFALLGFAAAQAYFTTYDQIPELMEAGCPLHPESLIAAALEANGATRLPLVAEFSTLRPNGIFRLPEISQIDLAHASLT